MVVTAAADVTPEWLTSILHKNGIRAEVSEVQVMLSKHLPVSTVHRLGIQYEEKRNDAERPGTLFLKLGGAKGGFKAADLAKPEVQFYKKLASRIGCPPLVRCYDAAFDEATGRSHALLEDLTETHTQPDQTTAPSPDLSRRAVDAVAKVHASCWSIPELGTKVGNAFTEEWLSSFVEDLGRNVREFEEVADLTERQRYAYRLMLDAAPTIWGRLLDTQGLTVTHGDLHWWNFLYPKDVAKDSIRVFDWQLWHLDLGARDLAFLLALGGFAEPRPEIEEELLRVYHNALDVDCYSFEMLMEDYRWSAIRNLNIPVIFWKQGKHYTTWQTTLRRSCEAYERLACAELL